MDYAVTRRKPIDYLQLSYASCPKSHLGDPETVKAGLRSWKSGLEGEDSSVWLSREQGRQEVKQQKASRHQEEAFSIAQQTLWTLKHSCPAFISPCACVFMNTGCQQRCNPSQKCCSWARFFPVGMRGGKLCPITHKIQPEMLAAKGTNDSLWENAWIQSSQHALTEEHCPGGWLRRVGVRAGLWPKAGACYRNCICCCGNKAGSDYECGHKCRLFQDGFGWGIPLCHEKFTHLIGHLLLLMSCEQWGPGAACVWAIWKFLTCLRV